MSVKIVGCAGFLPDIVITNSALSELVDTTDEWINSRTGISQRYISSKEETVSYMAYKASIKAIDDASIKSSDIDMIIVCSTTPDRVFPSVASRLQGLLELINIPAFDLQAVCSGFIYGLHIANALIQTRKYRTILLVGSEKMSSLLNWSDRNTSVLFGDGAGAVILQYSNDNAGILDSEIFADGKFNDILYTDINLAVDNTDNRNKIIMNGKEVFKHAIEKMSESSLSILKKNNLNISDIDFFVPHQANLRIIDAIVKKLDIDDYKVVKTITLHANTSAASIPLALSSLKDQGRLSSGNIILFSALGAGLTWGSALLRW